MCDSRYSYLGLSLSCQGWWPMWEHADLLCLRLDSPELCLASTAPVFIKHTSLLPAEEKPSQWWKATSNPRHAAGLNLPGGGGCQQGMGNQDAVIWRKLVTLGVCTERPSSSAPLKLEDLLENRSTMSQKPLRRYPNRQRSPWPTCREEGRHWEP